MSAKNEKTKLTSENRFLKYCGCSHTRLASIRWDKRNNSRQMRRINKKYAKTLLTNKKKCDIMKKK